MLSSPSLHSLIHLSLKARLILPSNHIASLHATLLKQALLLCSALCMLWMVRAENELMPKKKNFCRACRQCNMVKAWSLIWTLRSR